MKLKLIAYSEAPCLQEIAHTLLKAPSQNIYISRLADNATISAINLTWKGETFSLLFLRFEISGSQHLHLALKKENQLLGKIHSRYYPESNQFKMDTAPAFLKGVAEEKGEAIYVTKNARKEYRGIGTTLLKLQIEIAKELRASSFLINLINDPKVRDKFYIASGGFTYYSKTSVLKFIFPETMSGWIEIEKRAN